MSHRTEQIESTLKRVIAEVLQRRIADPRIEGLISITRVKVSPDLHEAQVYVSVLPEPKQKKVLYGLRHATGHIQSLVRKAVAFKTVPHLEFRLDETLKREAKIYEAIQRGVEKTGAEDEADSPESTPPPDQDAEG